MTASVVSFVPRALAAALLTACLATTAWAQSVTVTDAWVRGTVPQQQASGLFAKVTAAQGGKLVAASSPVAAVVEVHEMSMEGTTMRMRPLAAGLDLPAGQVVELKPGGYHVMMMGLKQQLKDGDTVPVTLVVELPGGQRENIEVQAPVRKLGAMPAAGHGGMKH